MRLTSLNLFWALARKFIDACCWWGGLSTRAEGLKPEAQPSWLWCGADFGSWTPSLSLPVLSQDGFVLLGAHSRAWPGHGSTSCCSGSPVCLPWPPSPGHTLEFSLGVIYCCGCAWQSFLAASSAFLTSILITVLWCSSQASSESWAGWTWGICPFSPAPSLSFCFFWNWGSSGARLHPAGWGIHSLMQPGSGSSFQPYLDLHSSACPKKNCMWWVEKPGSMAEIFFLLHFQLSVYLLQWGFSWLGSQYSVVVDLCPDTQNFSACSHIRCSD